MALNSTPCSSITPSEFTNIFPNAKLVMLLNATAPKCFLNNIPFPKFSGQILHKYTFDITSIWWGTKLRRQEDCFRPPTMSYLVVSAGLLRIFGRNVAELPLVATSRAHQGKRLLSSLNVEKLVLPAAGDAESIWTMKLGFRKMSEDQILPVGHESILGNGAPGSFPGLKSRFFCLLRSLARPSVSEAELLDLSCPILSFKFPFPVLAIFSEEFSNLPGSNG
ncbi:hypothetical protein JHK85_053284 [Glycine max]|nr:hypothetical protein JHK85_053284 [Glycine max]